MTQVRLCRFLAFSVLALGLGIFSAGCGKKGDPTLKSFEQPEAPTQLRAVHRENQLILQWDYPRGQEAKLSDFILYKSSGGEFEKLTHVERSGRNYADADIKPGTPYQYKVVAQNYRGVYSNDSNTLSVTPGNVPAAPYALSLTFKENSVIVSWKHEDAGATFNVYRSLEKEKFGMTPFNRAPLTERFITDALNTQRAVYYIVRAQSGGTLRGEGPASSVLIMDPADLVPGPPTRLQHLAGEDKTFLSWESPGEPWLKGFRIYRRDEGKDWRVIGETQIPSFVDNEAPKTRCDYRVHALGPVNEGKGVEAKGVVFSPQR